MKATYGEITKTVGDGVKETWSQIEPREIFKDPVTDDGTKKSKKGLLRVEKPMLAEDQHKGLQVYDQQTWGQELGGLLQTVFKDGKLVKTTTLEEIRNRLK